MENRTRIFVTDLADGARRLLTDGPKDGGPSFSPDGTAIAFLRDDDQRRRQAWLVPVAGGRPRQVTSLAGGASQPAWSPDGTAIAFLSDVDPDRVPPGHDAKTDPRVRVVRRIRYQGDTVGWRGDAHHHLFVVPVTGGEPRQLTDGDWDDRAPAWSPDGRAIAFTSERRDDRDLTLNSEAYIVPADGGAPALCSEGLWDVNGVTWSPAGDALVGAGSDDRRIAGTWQGALFLMRPGEAPYRLSDDAVKVNGGFPPTVPAPEVRWTSDGRLLYLGDVRGESYLFETTLADGKTRRVHGGGALLNATTDREGTVAIVLRSAPDVPADLWRVTIADGTAARLTHANADYLAAHVPATMEKFSVRRAGLEIECRLLFPPDFDAARRYPMVVDVHGGPHGAFYDGFNATQQVLATGGYLVLLVNPRGSSTYGGDFAKAVLGDWGGEDYLDILAAVDEVCHRPYVDASRLGIHGYSYGGFMTAWTVGHDHRFKAAVVGAPVINLESMYGTSDIGVSFGELQWGGPRHEALAKYRERSPLTYAEHVRTPVLLLHGEVDHRCPIEQSEQFFVALKRLGKTVEFVRFPDCSHLFLRAGHPKMREAYYARTLAWFNRWL